MLKAVHWDLDGTIVDTEPHAILHLSAFLQTFNASPTPETFEKFRGVNAYSFYGFIKEEYRLSVSLEELIQKGRASYLNYLDSLPELVTTLGATDLIESLQKAGIIQTIASSASPKRVALMIKKAGLDKYFPDNLRVNGDDVKESKPAPDAYLIASKKAGVSPKDSIAIEDATNGVLSAKAAGMYCVALKAGSSNQDLSKADLVVKDFTELSVEKLKSLID